MITPAGKRIVFAIDCYTPAHKDVVQRVFFVVLVPKEVSDSEPRREPKYKARDFSWTCSCSESFGLDSDSNGQ